ncbi:MAG: tRNA (adenosine(37)-N6)-threonylcarbamoyltransferase complex dimerization subunit type 1 TsaB [Syntrophaceae bacterium]|nr:tRNA (adenosine(37)-N6)-threonylcarbamoyltransferase complex dimerization subunit type 1 TsaB [Syntrophaceae bacterium]
MLILGVETSTRTGSIALVEALTEDAGPPRLTIVGETTLTLAETHSSRLMPAVDRLLRETSQSIQTIRALAVGLGPGSFTGLRIAVSTVKGLAFALRVPVVGAPTLNVLAQNLSFSPIQVCPVLDARKKEVYAALFRGNGEGRLTKLSEDWVLSPEELCSRITEKTVLVGNGGEVYGDIFRERLGSRVLFAPPEISFPRASNAVRLTLPALLKGEFLDLFGFTPIYVRRSEAEIHRDRKEGAIASSEAGH